MVTLIHMGTISLNVSLRICVQVLNVEAKVKNLNNNYMSQTALIF